MRVAACTLAPTSPVAFLCGLCLALAVACSDASWRARRCMGQALGEGAVRRPRCSCGGSPRPASGQSPGTSPLLTETSCHGGRKQRLALASTIRSGFRLGTRPDASPLASGVCSGEAAPAASKKRLARAADIRSGLPPLDKPRKLHRGSCPTVRLGPPRQAGPLTVPVLLLRRLRSSFSLAPWPRPSQRPASCRRAQ